MRTKSVLPINGGSSSIKFAIYGMGEKPECKLSGGISRIGLVNTEFNYKEMQDQLSSQKVRASDFKEASISLIDWLEKQGSFDKVRCAEQFNNLINHESGMLGISEISADMQDLHNPEGPDERAAEAVSLFCYQVKKWIGAFTAVLEGMDVLVFSGGIEEHSASIRSRICGCFHYAGLNWMKSKTKKMPSKFQIIRVLLKCWLFPPMKS